jgi:hypothetical protein
MSSDSIIDPERAPSPLLANSSFEAGALPPWQIGGQEYASVSVTRRLSWDGEYSARVSASGRRVRGSVVIWQIVAAAQAARGSRYRLALRARTLRLNRPIQVEIKLSYDDDSFDFVAGRAVAGPPGFPKSRAGIPPGTWRRWITLKADAVAKRPVRDIHIFAFDSGPGPLRGTVWVDGVELSAREPKEA